MTNAPIASLFTQIGNLVPTLGGWTSVIKAQTFAALILSYKPAISVELGAWYGRGALSLALAHKEIGKGSVIAVDAWSANASIEGQVNEADRKHWGAADHEIAYQTFLSNIQKLGLQDRITVQRCQTKDAQIPDGVGFLIVDANHGPEAISDVNKFAPKVLTGGFVYLDDLDWAGFFVRKAEAQLRAMGFRELYPIETGALYQRI